MFFLCIPTAAFEQCERAFHLGLAALLAEKVYNFGEIVSMTVLCLS